MAKHSVEDFDREHKNHVRVYYDNNGNPYMYHAMWMTLTIAPSGGMQTIPAITQGGITGWRI